MRAVHAYEEFTAIHDHMPGSDGALRVKGTVVFVQGGWTAELREHRSGFNPSMLVLELVLTGPPPGTAVPEVLTPVPVEYTDQEPKLEYTQVEFRLETETEDEPPPLIEVDHPQ